MAEASGVIGKGIRVKGDIYGTGGLVIEGEVDGRIQVDQVSIESGSNVTAELQARKVVIHGSASGVVDAQDQVVVKAGAAVVADLRAPSVVIEEGAAFKGSIQMDVQLPDDL